MAVNKVEYAGNTLIDLTADTVTAETLAQGVTAHAANGEPITGTLVPVADPTLQSKTVTPAASVQSVTADAGYDGLDTVTVNAIPSEYVRPTATKEATTYTPKTTAQTIAAGTYCSGAQTIAGDANLVAANIVSGKSIFGVAGRASSGAQIETGTFTISNNTTTYYSVAHNLGTMPNFAVLIKTSTDYPSSTSNTLALLRNDKTTTVSCGLGADNSHNLKQVVQNITWDSSSARFATLSGMAYKLYGTYTYLIAVL